MNLLVRFMTALAWMCVSPAVWADEVIGSQHHRPGESGASPSQPEQTCGAPHPDGFENLQIETSDIRLYERFFEGLLHAPVIQRLDHPLTDHLRTYCYRGVLVVIRQDLRTPRQTGWVQLNLTVRNVAAVQQELEAAYQSSIARLSEEERDKVVRFRMKPDVMRGGRKVMRLEVYGPEGFLLGFDQPQER